MPKPSDLVACFLRVREIPYSTDGAHDGADLLRVGHGNCHSKAEFLATELSSLGVQTRLVRWCYELPAWPPEVKGMPTRRDIHTATEAEVNDTWVLVDATHDGPLLNLGLSVSEWDGRQPTPPGYLQAGPVWRVGRDDAAIDDAINELCQRLATGEDDQTRYQAAFNARIRHARAATNNDPHLA